MCSQLRELHSGRRFAAESDRLVWRCHKLSCSRSAYRSSSLAGIRTHRGRLVSVREVLSMHTLMMRTNDIGVAGEPWPTCAHITAGARR